MEQTTAYKQAAELFAHSIFSHALKGFDAEIIMSEDSIRAKLGYTSGRSYDLLLGPLNGEKPTAEFRITPEGIISILPTKNGILVESTKGSEKIMAEWVINSMHELIP